MDRGNMAAPECESTKIFIINTYKIPITQLKEYFCRFGDISKFKYFTPKGKTTSAVIRFLDNLSARKALAASPHHVAEKKVSGSLQIDCLISTYSGGIAILRLYQCLSGTQEFVPVPSCIPQPV